MLESPVYTGRKLIAAEAPPPRSRPGLAECPAVSRKRPFLRFLRVEWGSVADCGKRVIGLKIVEAGRILVSLTLDPLCGWLERVAPERTKETLLLFSFHLLLYRRSEICQIWFVPANRSKSLCRCNNDSAALVMYIPT